MKRVMLIRNAEAGVPRKQSTELKIQKILRRHYDEVHVKEEGEHSRDAAKRACNEGYDTVVVYGGDGTIDEVVAVLSEYEKRPKLAILPGGTFNMVARIMGLPMNPVAAIRKINFHKTVPMHVGRANDRVFTFILSTGPISKEIHDVPRADKKKYGALAYMVNILKVLPKMRSHEIRLETEDLKYEGGASNMLFILNQAFLTFRKNVFREDDPAGLLFVAKGSSVTIALPAFAKILAKGTAHTEDLILERTESFRYDADELKEFDVDGDLGGEAPIDVEILKNHLEIFVPKRWSPFAFLRGKK